MIGRVPENGIEAVRAAFLHVYHFTLSVNMRHNAYHTKVFNTLKKIGIVASHKTVSVHDLDASVQNVRTLGPYIKHDIVFFDTVLDR